VHAANYLVYAGPDFRHPRKQATKEQNKQQELRAEATSGKQQAFSAVQTRHWWHQTVVDMTEGTRVRTKAHSQGKRVANS